MPLDAPVTTATLFVSTPIEISPSTFDSWTTVVAPRHALVTTRPNPHPPVGSSCAFAGPSLQPIGGFQYSKRTVRPYIRGSFQVSSLLVSSRADWGKRLLPRFRPQ